MLDHVSPGLAQPRVNLVQFGLVFDLDAEMIETRLAAARRDGKIHPRVVEHPLGVIRLDDGGLCVEQRRVEADRLLQVLDGHVNMHAFHEGTS